MNDQNRNLLVFATIFSHFVAALVFAALGVKELALLLAIIVTCMIVYWAYRLVIDEEKTEIA